MNRRDKRHMTNTILSVAIVLFIAWLAMSLINHNYPIAAAHCTATGC